MQRTLLNRLPWALMAALALGAIAAAQDNAADTKLLAEVLGLHPGAIVADIGAGDGVLTIPISHIVTGSGRVYATELGGRPLEELRRAIASSEAGNVEVVEGDPLRTNLPEECCDAIFARNVYHHFRDPIAMDKSLWQSLKPGGRLAIIDFAPNGAEASSPVDRANGKSHGVTAATVERELREAGFELITTQPREHKAFLVLGRKPD